MTNTKTAMSDAANLLFGQKKNTQKTPEKKVEKNPEKTSVKPAGGEADPHKEEIEQIRQAVKSTPLGSASKAGRPVKGAKTNLWPKERTMYTSNAFDINQYEKLREISRRDNVPIKEVIYQMIEIGLEAYDKGKFTFDYYWKP